MNANDTKCYQIEFIPRPREFIPETQDWINIRESLMKLTVSEKITIF